MKKNIQGLFFGLLLLAITGGLSWWIWNYQQNNLKPLYEDMDKIRIPTAVHIPKDQINVQITALQQIIDDLKVDNASKIELKSQITALKENVKILPEEIIAPKERLAIEKDLFALKKDLKNAENAIINTILQGIGGLFFFLTVLISWQNYQVTQDKQIAERFSKAVEQLESDKVAVQLGGIYALERIATDSIMEHWTIMEVLTSFIRVISSSDDRENLKVVTPIIQAAITVIGRRNFNQDQKNKKLDLSKVNLTKVDLRGGYFRGAILDGIDLREANLEKADLREIYLGKANLSKANLNGARLNNVNCNVDLSVKSVNFSQALLIKAHLTEAKLTGANLSETDLNEADLRYAYLYEANFTNARLVCADLRNADLSNANLNGANLDGAKLNNTNIHKTNFTNTKGLTANQIKTAQDWKDAIYDENFQQVLGLSFNKHS